MSSYQFSKETFQSHYNNSSQPSEFTAAFCICRHRAAINKNHYGKILPTLFFMLMKTIKCKGKTES